MQVLVVSVCYQVENIQLQNMKTEHFVSVDKVMYINVIH